MSKLRVFIISQEEPFYLPKVIRHVLEQQGNQYEVIGATRLKPHRKNKTMKDWLQERTKIYTWWELFIAFKLFAWCKFLTILGASTYSVKKTYAKYSIQEIATNDINSSEYLEQLQAQKIDVILSVSPPQLFETGLLQMPKYCLNAHGTLLPRHRGVFGSWWTLFENDKEAGTTIHTMEEKLDAGEVVWQQSFPVVANDTQYSIAYKTKRIMAFGLVETLRNIAKNQLPVITSEYGSSYHRAPTREQGKAFHKKGLRVITLANIKHVLARRFSVN